MITIFHNPRCRNSRGTLEILRNKGFELEVRLYLENPPTVEELRTIAEQLGMRPIEFTRTKEAAFAEVGLSKKSSDEEIIAAMHAHPILIERPIVIFDNKKAVVSRPPERILEFL